MSAHDMELDSKGLEAALDVEVMTTRKNYVQRVITAYLTASGLQAKLDHRLKVIAENERLLNALIEVTRERDEWQKHYRGACDRYSDLAADNAVLRGVLKPFARLGQELIDNKKPHDRAIWGFNCTELTYGDFHRARAALSNQSTASLKVGPFDDKWLNDGESRHVLTSTGSGQGERGGSMTEDYVTRDSAMTAIAHVELHNGGNRAFEARRMLVSATTPAPQPLGAVKVKALDWSEVQEPNGDCPYHHVKADGAFGRYTIEWKGWKDHDDRTIFLRGEFIGNGGLDLEKAKAAAQGDYERRILSAIEGYSR